MRRISVFLLVTTAAIAPALADEAPDTIVITATRTEQPLERVGQTITVIEAGELQRRQTATVVDILRTVPGVTIARNGGIGGTTSVFIRGAESDQTVALIDGVKINDPSSPGGGFDFGNLLIGNIERIEVLRGAQSVLWGSQAIGGVVNMITAPPTEALSVNLRGEYGYRNTGQVVGNISGKSGPLSASAGAGYFRTDGISAYDAALGGKENDGFRNFGANAKVNLALTDTVSVEARGYYSNSKAAIDGYAPPAYDLGDTLEQARTRDLVGYAGVNVALFDGRFHNRLGYAYTDTKRRNIDPTSDPVETFAGDGRNQRLEYQGVFDIAKGWQATGGFEREISRYATSSYGGPQTFGRARLDSLYGQLLGTPLPNLTLTAGVRHDDHDRFGGATTFGTSGVWTPGGKGTTLRASYSEGFKVPSLYQLQGDYGNEALRPERSKGWDAGLTQRLLDGAIEASATYFHRDSTDLIDFIGCSKPFTGICFNRPYGTYDNVARARSEGIELALALHPFEALRLTANYSHIAARNRSAASSNFGNQLLRRPQDSASVLADYRWSFGLETGATVTMVGASFEDAANTNRVQGYALADIRVAMPVGHGVEVYGRIENLFDEKYETIYQYGTPGRAGYVGVRLHY